jgi:hypothetical protein
MKKEEMYILLWKGRVFEECGPHHFLRKIIEQEVREGASPSNWIIVPYDTMDQSILDEDDRGYINKKITL